MDPETEPIEVMAATIYTQLHSDKKWFDLDLGVRDAWLRATARGWERYWEQREYLETKGSPRGRNHTA